MFLWRFAVRYSNWLYGSCGELFRLFIFFVFLYWVLLVGERMHFALVCDPWLIRRK